MRSDSKVGHDGFLDLAGLRFHYREWGNGTVPPLILLHAASLSGRAYDHIAHQLSGTRRVLVLDQRGHGETEWASDYAWQRWIEDVEGFADALGLVSFYLVGHSMGGAVASRFAGMHPDRVENLILLDAWYADIVYNDSPANSRKDGATSRGLRSR